MPQHSWIMAFLEASADTNAGQGHILNHCIKNLYCYYLKSLLFKHSSLFIHTLKNTTQLLKTFFLSQSFFTNAIIILPLIDSILSKQVFIAVSDFGARKKEKFETWHFGSIFPTIPRQRLNPHHREGLTNQIPHSPTTESSQMPAGG